jgi:hypothetical protein
LTSISSPITKINREDALLAVNFLVRDWQTTKVGSDLVEPVMRLLSASSCLGLQEYLHSSGSNVLDVGPGSNLSTNVNFKPFTWQM